MSLPRVAVLAAILVGPFALPVLALGAPKRKHKASPAASASASASASSSASTSAAAPSADAPVPAPTPAPTPTYAVVPAAPEKPAAKASADTADAHPPAAHPEEETRLSGDRTLGGHTFPFPILQPETAFITTHFGVQEGFVLATYPKLPAGTLGTFNLQLTGYAQQIGLGVKVTDFLGLFINANGQLVTGTDVPSIVLGSNAFTVNVEGGGVIRLMRSDEAGLQVSVRFSGGAGIGRNTSVSELIDHLQKADLDPVLNSDVGNYVLYPTSSWTMAGSLLAAKSIIPDIGLLASVELRHTANTQSPYDATTNTNITSEADTNQVAGTVALSLDGAPVGFPLALQPEYQVVAASIGGPGGINNTFVEHFLAVGLYYTGRRHLQVGIGGEVELSQPPIQGVDANGNPAQSGSPSIFGGQFILRYVW